MTITTTGQKALITYSVIADQPRASAYVDVVAIDGDKLRYTTDGVWFSEITRSSRADWRVVDEPNWIGAKVHHDDRPQRVPILGGIMVAERGVITVTAPTGQRFGLADAYQVAAEHGTGALLRVDTLDERGGVVDWRSAHRVTTRWTFEAPAATTCPIHGAGCEAWA